MLRTIAELLIDLKFLRTDPSLPNLYREYTHVANHRRYKQLNQFPLFVSSTTQQTIDNIKREYDRVKTNYQNEAPDGAAAFDVPTKTSSPRNRTIFVSV